jgi:outer membrane usher protein
MLKPRYHVFTIFLIILLDKNALKAFASEAENGELIALDNRLVSFNSSALFGNTTQVDLSRFQIKNYVNPGVYASNISLNDRNLGEINVRFDHLDGSQSAVLCIDPNLLKKLDLTNEILEILPDKSCLLIKDIHESAYYVFDQSELKLNIYIPQLLVIDRPKGYIDPALFSDGVNSAYVAYNYNYNNDGNNESQYLSLNGGINLNGWFYRHSGYFESADSGIGDYKSSQNVLYKDITKINSRLSLGQFNTQIINQDSVRILGAQLSSDSEMLPWSIRNPGLEIENIAYTNAVVKIYQNGSKIYEKSVPTGPFKISDLSSYSDGDLVLEINETGGEQRTFIIRNNGNTSLLKKGRVNYSISAGQYYIQNEAKDDYVFQHGAEYGMSNYISGGYGLSIAPDFYSLGLKGNFSTPIGNFSTQVEAQKAEFARLKLNGHRYSINYNYRWRPLDLNFGLNYNAYDDQYIGLSNFLYKKHNENPENNPNFNYSYNLKNSYGIYLSKSFSNRKFGSVNLNYQKNSYWNDSSDYNQFTFSYGNSFKRINYNLRVSQTSYSNNDSQKDNLSAYLSIYFPLKVGKKSLYLNNYTQYNDNSKNTNNTTQISGTFGSNNELNFGMGYQTAFSNRESQQDSWNGSLTYRLPQATVSSTISSNSDNTQYSVSANGAVVAHRYGVSLTNSEPSTYTIIHVKDAKGAKILNAWGVQIDRFGNAIYPYNSPYNVNTISLDPQNLPVNVSLESNQTQVIPKRFSSQLVLFESKVSSNILLTIASKDRQKLPIGSQLYDVNNLVIGMLGPTQQILLDNKNSVNEMMTLKWGKQAEESCVIQPIKTLSNKKKFEDFFEIVDVECE